MGTSALSRYALTVSAAAAFLAGCGGLQPQLAAPGAMPQGSALAARTNSKNYKVLYSFGADPDGNYPHSNLIGVGGTFYGTTFAGGAYHCGSSSCGTVFSITAGGEEKVLHRFGKGADGFQPVADMNYEGGSLVGTTYLGGVYGVGTIFSLTL